LSVLLLDVVPVAAMVIYRLAGIWLGFGFRHREYCWLLLAKSITGLRCQDNFFFFYLSLQQQGLYFYLLLFPVVFMKLLLQVTLLAHYGHLSQLLHQMWGFCWKG
jgi:hypothetical protein